MKNFRLAALTISLVVITSTSIVFAEDYYTILKRSFREADQAIAEIDFDRPGFPLSRICIEIHPDRPMADSYVMINRYTRVIEGQGPLLPKTTITKVIFRPYNTDVFAGYLFDQITSEFSLTEVISRQDDGQGKIMWTISIRKLGDNLHFEREYLAGEETKVTYGYCFHRESKK